MGLSWVTKPRRGSAATTNCRLMTDDCRLRGFAALAAEPRWEEAEWAEALMHNALGELLRRHPRDGQILMRLS